MACSSANGLRCGPTFDARRGESRKLGLSRLALLPSAPQHALWSAHLQGCWCILLLWWCTQRLDASKSGLPQRPSVVWQRRQEWRNLLCELETQHCCRQDQLGWVPDGLLVHW